ncbi:MULTISPECIES: hypothetical protein [unclassified Micromonospora]|uniref:hypothetical protein n=1 Tax=unclassified Micromonospora TaxID=2617518 RepID=UPI0022B6E2E5|nr:MULTISPECIES: hypothetical protein [unclassified Micromonospora]MCZ7473099.1 hypothetical protein [Micromonospora sp. WMMC273]WBC03776.1 hypothetical protein O7546_02005 [Micromonospora sp. WMMA1976]
MDRIPGSKQRLWNTYPEATTGQWTTAVVVALALSAPAGLLCVWLATSLLSGTHWLLQTLAFAVVGLVIGGGALVLLSKLAGRGGRRAA